MSGSLAWTTVADHDGPSQRTSALAARPQQRTVLSARDVAELVGGYLAADSGAASGPDDEPVKGLRGISLNSATIEPGDLFAAVPGATGHGIEHAPAARAAGAAAVLTDEAGLRRYLETPVVDRPVPVIVVADPRSVLGAISAAFYGAPASRLPVIGITGTSGKTTTSFLVRAGMQAAGLNAGLIGTVGVFIGTDWVKTPFTTPEAPQIQALLAVMAERGADHVIMEVSSHALRMKRADGIGFAVGAFTNLSQDHLDFHADMEDYFQAKALLFDGRAAQEIIVIDDEWGRRLAATDPAGRRRVTVSLEGPADWRVSDLVLAADGSSRFTVHSPTASFPAGCRIPGRYNVANTLLALAILAACGVDPAAVAEAVAAAQVPGRMETVDAGQPYLAVVDYSHKPAGVEAALRALRPLTAGRLIVVLGCGGDRDRGKRPLMGEVAARGADLLIVTDDNPRSEDPAAIRAAMYSGAMTVAQAARAELLDIGDRRGAIERAVAAARPGDTVLVAGKGHEAGQEIAGQVHPFDDVQVLRAVIDAAGRTGGAT
jgi:UDP-N-acetylmuramoyl-L-alanyl-D-glutamate--2,6-diaminopimelate ligase